MMKQSLEDQMAADTKDMNDEKAGKEAAAEDKATAEGDLATASLPVGTPPADPIHFMLPAIP